jgi:uncharacterized membrane protein
MSFREIVENTGKVLDGLGVAVIVVGVLVAVALTYRASRQKPPGATYRSFRQQLGRAILLGLELLVAADIIRTVAVQPTLRSASVLGIIVVIRTFLSFSLEVELEGRWPWQPADPASHQHDGRVPIAAQTDEPPAPGAPTDDSERRQRGQEPSTSSTTT